MSKFLKSAILAAMCLMMVLLAAMPAWADSSGSGEATDGDTTDDGTTDGDVDGDVDYEYDPPPPPEDPDPFCGDGIINNGEECDDGVDTPRCYGPDEDEACTRKPLAIIPVKVVNDSAIQVQLTASDVGAYQQGNWKVALERPESSWTTDISFQVGSFTVAKLSHSSKETSWPIGIFVDVGAHMESGAFGLKLNFDVGVWGDLADPYDDGSTSFLIGCGVKATVGNKNGGIALGPELYVLGPIGHGESSELLTVIGLTGYWKVSGFIGEVTLGAPVYVPNNTTSPEFRGLFLSLKLGYFFRVTNGYTKKDGEYTEINFFGGSPSTEEAPE